MPFGLAKSESVFSRMLDVAMKEVDRDFWTSYLYKILNYSGKPWDHFGHLTQVVLAQAAAGIKIQPRRTKLFQSKVEYLRHKMSKGGVSMILEYLQKIKDWLLPKTGKEVATFLGFSGYYRTFVPQYSVLTIQLKWIKKVEKFMRNKEIERDFIKLKKAFTEGGIQAFPDFGVGDPFILTSNLSKENIAGALSQVQDGQERFIRC